MKYKITIQSFCENPNYEAELAALLERQNSSKRNNYRFDLETVPEDHISKMKTERVLEVFLTEEEFKKVKSEVIKVFE